MPTRLLLSEIKLVADPKVRAKDKVMDVAKPSKPASHALMTTAPADGGNQLPQTEDAQKPAVPSASRVKIEPLSSLESLTAEASTKTEVRETNDSSDDSVDSGDKLKDPNQDEQDLIDRKAAERQANFDKLALAKTYYLPINQLVRRRSQHVVVAGAVVIAILGLAWADVALDAGLISIAGVKAPTHFFSK